AREHICTSPYRIQPADIIRQWRAYQRDQLARHTDPIPAADPDDPAAYPAALSANRQAVAAGTEAPSPHRQLTTVAPRAPPLPAAHSASRPTASSPKRHPRAAPLTAERLHCTWATAAPVPPELRFRPAQPQPGPATTSSPRAATNPVRVHGPGSRSGFTVRV